MPEYAEWEIIEGVPNAEGKAENRYFFRGKSAYRFPITSARSKQCAGYKLIERDLRNLLSWHELLTDLVTELHDDLPQDYANLQRQGDPKKNNHAKALFVAILSIYGKLFTQAKGRRVKLEPDIIKNPDLRGLHDELMVFRHNFAAHSGEEKSEEAINVYAFVVVDGQVKHNLFTEMSQPNNVGPKDLAKMRKLFEFLHVQALSKFNELRKELDSNEGEMEMRSALALYERAGLLRRLPEARK